MRQAGTATERKRVETVVGALAAVRGRGESLAEVAHDARNMVAALELYCDLLDQPGVLGLTFTQYAGELRLVAAASRKLVEKLVTLEDAGPQQFSFLRNVSSRSGERGNGDWKNRETTGGKRPLESVMISPLALARFCDPLPLQPVASLAAELHATRNLLAALAGPSIAVTVDIRSGALPVSITAEDLTRALVNLVKNAVEVMPDGGELRISLREKTDRGSRRLTLSVEDSGPGIPSGALEMIFAAGYTAHPVRLTQTMTQTMSQAKSQAKSQECMAPHRGLGLAITRSIVEAAGGSIFAENRPQGGARIVMELPIKGEKRARDWD